MKTFNAISSQDIADAIEDANRGARVRTLDPAVSDLIVERIAELEARARAIGAPLHLVYLRIDGGGVAKSYKYSAETTAVIFDGGSLRIARVPAMKTGRGAEVMTGGIRGPGNGGIKTF